jgi:hypothetical protein
MPMASSRAKKLLTTMNRYFIASLQFCRSRRTSARCSRGPRLAWRQARAGRIVRLTLGGLDVEAGTPGEIDALLEQAQARQATAEGTNHET